MGARFLVTVDDDADAAEVEAGLRGAGAVDVVAPRPELPGVFVATVEGEDPGFVAKATALPGVVVAEPDAWVSPSDAAEPLI